MQERLQEETRSRKNQNTDDVLNLYFSSEEFYGELLKPRREKELATRIQKGTIVEEKVNSELLGSDLNEDAYKAFVELVDSNLKLVVFIAARYKGVTLLDCIQEGNIGLMTAARYFNPDKKTRFSTYATSWIKQKIGRYIANSERTIRIPINRMAKMMVTYRAQERLLKKIGRVPYVSEISAVSGQTIKEVKENLRLLEHPKSLDYLVSKDDGGEIAFGETIPDNQEGIEEKLIIKQRFERFYDLLNRANLSPIEVEVMKFRFSLNGDHSHAMTAVMKHFGMSQKEVEGVDRRTKVKLRLLASRDKSRDSFIEEQFSK
jgi:RNA polymerase sigma factor (sigma-70 family)